MQNIQDLKEKIFFESKNIIDILEKINNVDELLSKQDLVDELANRISFLRLLEKNIEYFITENTSSVSENNELNNNEIIEEEAIFNNELNEIDEKQEVFAENIEEEEAIFNNQLNEIAENEYHENIISFVGENLEPANTNESSASAYDQKTNEEAVYDEQLKEIEENSLSEYHESALDFVDEERILAEAKPDNADDISEEMFHQKVTEEEAIFNNQLNEIEESENKYDEEEKNFAEETITKESSEISETIPSIFDTEMYEEEAILIEEDEDQFVVSNVAIEQGEMITETSNVENILTEIKHEDSTAEEEKEEEIVVEEDNRRGKIVDFETPPSATEKEKPASDESFENLEKYHQDKKIRLANIRGLKAVQTLFDDDHLETPENFQQKPVEVKKEDTGSLLKMNVSTEYMEKEKEKSKPEFKLDLNDRIAFSKMLFGGSQSELNEVVADLNSFKNLEEAKEYLSDLYYDKKWEKVDEYAQRLWVLVENKFL
ncbi:hypothetical protein [Chryseobacterium geocarposphaerae]|uniref:Uncharacterized protein n=1 Tax=Chryseobacterium geocarposphaerae TaxID=1416776 RepID=A0A2M9C261_9FLAO|nr:hypothetical protein [Chryseobacterium geocarposphaerae]PJJ64532.1 hypothetical protein CLV73_2893 [Chryseobacterium geocarposphaerae]